MMLVASAISTRRHGEHSISIPSRLISRTTTVSAFRSYRLDRFFSANSRREAVEDRFPCGVVLRER